MSKDYIAHSMIMINAPASKVWDALTNPDLIKQYFFGVDTISDWQVGSSIVWKGEWDGKSFEDKGEILKINNKKLLQFTHYSPLSGKPDTLENYHIVTIELAPEGIDQTQVTLSQNNNLTKEARDHSEKNWSMMLEGLKKTVESN